MDGCKHHSHISEKNDWDAICVKEKHQLWWCIVPVWCSLLYLCLSSVLNCHCCLLLFRSPPHSNRDVNTPLWVFFFFSFSWRCFKELGFQIWQIFVCFDPIAPLDAQTTRLKIRMTRRDADAAHRRLTASYVVLNQHKSVGDGSRQSNLRHVVTHPAQTDEIICYRI